MIMEAPDDLLCPMHLLAAERNRFYLFAPDIAAFDQSLPLE